MSVRLSLNTVGARAALYQVLAVVLVAGALGYLVHNTLTNLETRNIATGFGFLGREAAFAIGESLIDYEAADSYGRAFVVGLLNTLRVGLTGIVLATMIGIVIGLARLSTNWLVARLAAIYVETLRNIPLLLQLFFWYALITEVLPRPKGALNPFAGVFLSNRGLVVPKPVFEPAHGFAAIALLVGLVALWRLMVWARARRDRTGVGPAIQPLAVALVIGPPAVVLALGDAGLGFDMPALTGFNFRGGMTLSPEFAALLLGLTLYTAAFIAEIVRSGIQAISRGQWEAARALGLKPGPVLRLVILPQALRVIIPPLTSQYLNLVKNSSLAVAIGYPDLVSVANTTMNQTGQAIEGIAMIMAVYLFVSLAISLAMNLYNRAIALVER